MENSSIRSLVIKHAEKDLGLTESPNGSNKVKYNDWYFEEGSYYFKNSKKYAWCGTFVAYVYFHSGVFLSDDIHVSIVYIPAFQNLVRKLDLITVNPREGDAVVYDFNNDNTEDHIGIFYKWEEFGKTFWSIEGNTSPDEKGSQSNGGMVCKKLRHIDDVEGFYDLIG